MLTDEQMAALKEPLERSRVKQRRQGGRQVSYLEGYDVIDAANRVFGFDGWSYAVQDVAYTRMGDSAFYQARVWLKVGQVERTDVGFCDVAAPRDKGLDGASADAFGTAMKGAVTDGLKRALRTFGSQFGNSLYDKEDPAHCQPAEVVAPRCGCGQLAVHRSGTTAAGKPYAGWFCARGKEGCGFKRWDEAA